MSTYTDRANAIYARLRDLARDLESHLGLASRSYEAEPMFNRANHFPPHPSSMEALATVRESNVDRFVLEYTAQAGRAELALLELVPGVTLNAADKAAAAAVRDLVDRIRSVRNHDDAVALVTTIEEA